MKFLTRLVTVFVFLSVSTFCLSHTYYEGITDISVNTVKQRVEIVHRYTTHDLEILLSEKYSQRVTADQASYSKYLKLYIQNNFSLSRDDVPVTLEWVGIENGINVTVIYQLTETLKNLAGLMVNNQILTDFYQQQVNRTNYNDGALSGAVSGTLIFDSHHHSRKIESVIQQ